MAKKKVIDIQSFQSDLEGFMEQAMGEETFSSDSPLLGKKPNPKKKVKKTKTSSRKNFKGNLNLMLEDALKDNLQEQKKSPGSSKASIKRKHKRPLSGLDALIRETVETSKVAIEEGTKRRITVLFEPENLQKLKTIARLEKSFLKDIVNDVVVGFINDYEQNSGELST